MASTKLPPVSASEWRRAEQLQREYHSLSNDEAVRIADELAQECYDRGLTTSDGRPDIHTYVTEWAKDNPVTPTGKPFAFWSYESAPDTSSAPVSHRFVAQACAEARDYEVLETTDSGKKLDSYRLFDSKVNEALWDKYEITALEVKMARKEAWSYLSRSYTQAARGDSYVFAADVSRDSVLGRDELPEMIANSEVGLSRINFAIDFPETGAPGHEHLTTEINDFLAHDQVRAQVAMEFFSVSGPSEDDLKKEGIDHRQPAPHILADKLERITLSPDLHAERDRVVGRLRGVDSYDQLKGTGVAVAAGPAVAGRTEAVVGIAHSGVSASSGVGHSGAATSHRTVSTSAGTDPMSLLSKGRGGSMNPRQASPQKAGSQNVRHSGAEKNTGQERG